MDAESTIKTAKSSAELDEALGYVQRVYRRKYGTAPDTIWPDCIIGRNRQADIVGVIALQFSEGVRFEIEEQFLLAPAILVHPRKKLICVGRWAFENWPVGVALMYAALKLGLRRGRSYIISSSKPQMFALLRRRYQLDFKTFDLPLNPKFDASRFPGFFLSEPRPQVCIGSLQEWCAKLEPRLAGNIQIEM